jgi:hypothetical protein
MYTDVPQWMIIRSAFRHRPDQWEHLCPCRAMRGGIPAVELLTRLSPNQIQRNFAVRSALFAEGFPVNSGPSPSSKQEGMRATGVIYPQQGGLGVEHLQGSPYRPGLAPWQYPALAVAGVGTYAVPPPDEICRVRQMSRRPEPCLTMSPRAPSYGDRIQTVTKWQGPGGSVWAGRSNDEYSQAQVVAVTANNGEPRASC